MVPARADVGDSFFFDRLGRGDNVLNAKHTVRYKKDSTTNEEYYLIYTVLQIASDDYSPLNQNVFQLVRASPTEDTRIMKVKEVEGQKNGPGVSGSQEVGKIDAIASFEHVEVVVQAARDIDQSHGNLFVKYVHMGLDDSAWSSYAYRLSHSKLEYASDI